jgi:DNA polymerase/3'-5' exonuclease PolX
MKLAEACTIADEVSGVLRPRCQRILVAGSVRRRKAEVHDIELCAVPRFETVYDMFGQPKGEISLLETYPWALLGRVIKGGEKYKQIELKEGDPGAPINLDLFIVLPGVQDWGVIYTIRTGPVEFSHWIVTQRKRGGGLPSDCRVEGGRVYRGDQHLPMPEEIDLLNFLELGWVEPKDRQPGWKKS